MKFPLFISRCVRESSFERWPLNLSAREMAEAGFFYSGKSDQVYCFYCGLGLHEWESDDDPWKEHLKWSENCGYLECMTDTIKDYCGNMNSMSNESSKDETLLEKIKKLMCPCM